MKRSAKMKSVARGQFDAWADRYDRSLLNHFLFRPAHEAFLTELVGWRGEAGEPFDLLDVGCATGTLAVLLAGSTLPARVVGLDYSPAMCEQARRKAGRAGVGDDVGIVCADSEHLPFPDGSFDVITCSNSFHHYPHQEKVVRGMRRLLRPGGRLMIIDGFRDNVIGWFVFDVIIAKVEKAVHHVPWSRTREYFESAGFADIHQRKLNLWMPLVLTVGVADQNGGRAHLGIGRT